MSLAAALCLVAALLVGRPATARLRLSRSPAPVARQEELTRERGHRPVRAGLALVAGAGAVVASFGAAAGVVVSAVVAAALCLRAVRPARHAASDINVALCIDLLGAAMSCGAQPATALAAVASGVPAPVGAVLAEAATALSLGAEPTAVWAEVAAAVPPLDRAARACARAASSGAGVAAELFRLAAVARADAQVRRRRRLERAGVWLVLPLGLCFLPAFVLVAVVPVVLAAVPALAG